MRRIAKLTTNPLVIAVVASMAIAGCASKKTPNSAADLGLGAGAATPGSAQDFTVNVGDRIFFDTDSTSIRADAAATLDKPDDIYNAAYGHVLSGDYQLAEKEFRDYLEVFPEGEKAADASFWLGEAQYSQGNFNDAAKTFLNAHQTYGTSKKAPEMLLKLGMSLAALDNRETACATLREVGKRYPNASKAVKTKVTSEQGRLSC